MKVLALVLLLSSFASLGLMEVVDSFERYCSWFFVRNQNGIVTIPTVFSENQYKKICQLWQNKYRFATVYDTVRRIPVYSAYTFPLNNNKINRKNNWKIEPQLELIESYRNIRQMIPSPHRNQQIVENIRNQAVKSDYTNSSFTRGHVFPNQYAEDQEQADSTFTLTNIAPQTQNSNGQWARQVETPMLKQINNTCRLDQNHQAYIVTGVVPGNTWIPIRRGNETIPDGINIPSHFWSAFCCTNKNNIKQLSFQAYIAQQEDFTVTTLPIEDLNIQLSALYHRNFSVFPGLPASTNSVFY